MKTDPRTAHRIAIGEVTAVLRRTRLGAARQPVQFNRSRTMDDRAPRHAGDDTVTATRCHVLITDQRETTLGELTDQDAKRLGFRSRWRLREAWEAGVGPGIVENERYCRTPQVVWLVSFDPDTEERLRYLLPTGGYTTAASRALDTDERIVQTRTGPKRKPVALAAVSDAVLSDYAKEAHADRERRRNREALDRRALSLEERVRRARAEANRHGIDLTRQEARALEALKARDKGRAIAAVESMERKTENRAWAA